MTSTSTTTTDASTSIDDFIILSKEESYLKNEKRDLWIIEAEQIVEYRDVFIKFLEKSRFSYMVQLITWWYRWKEEQIYRSVETIDELVKSLDKLLDTYKKFKNKK